jgi:hypothetical protein
VFGGAKRLVQWIPAFAGMTGEADVRAMRLSCSEYSLVTMTMSVYESRAHRVSPDGDSDVGSGGLLHFFRFVVLSGAVGGKDDLQRSQTIEPTCACRYALGHTAQEVSQHQRVHVLPQV